jgi:hypothetical protein
MSTPSAGWDKPEAASAQYGGQQAKGRPNVGVGLTLELGVCQPPPRSIHLLEHAIRHPWDGKEVELPSNDLADGYDLPRVNLISPLAAPPGAPLGGGGALTKGR